MITLTTDFSEGSAYVAALKGVILSINPQVRLLDLSHRIPPQDLQHASFFLRNALPYFPTGTTHVVVIDPGVGTDRALLYVESAGQRLLVPDNGCWTELARAASRRPTVRRLKEPRYWRPQVSSTFHGRDILAPVAAHLSLGLDPELLGPLVQEWVCLDFPQPLLGEWALTGEVVFVDDFGNLISNIPGEAPVWAGREVRVWVGEREVTCRVRTYGEAPPGTLVTLTSSAGTVEVAVVQGSAACELGVGVGTPIRVESLPSPSVDR